MATTPASDVSSPAVVKTTTNGAVATASFSPPANSCLIVGITSDADSNAGTTPTITDSSGGAYTWTRVLSTGHSGSGDVGMVALFQGVMNNPGTAPGAITVTVTPNIVGPSKPKMLVCRVYTNAFVDIADPVGVIASGPFTSGTAMSSGTMTPETTGGGLRMLWLDWSATGTPTTFQANTELVDAYHNAGLSTNVQLGKQTATAAGVGETIGATLLASSTDGNWIAYEIRGVTITGPAFDVGAFDAGSFYASDGTSGTISASAPVVTGAASGTATGPTYTGSLAGTTPSATGSLPGAATGPVYTGALAATTPKTTAASSATATAPTYSGTLTSTTPKVTGSATGTAAAPVYTGIVAVTTPPTTGSVAGATTAPTYSGTVAANLPGPTSAAFTGTATAPTYTGTTTAAIPPTRSTTSGNVTTPAGAGTLLGTTPRATGAITGTVFAPVLTGTLNAQLARLVATSQAIVSAPQYTGTLAGVSPTTTGSLGGTVGAPAAITGTLVATLTATVGSIAGLADGPSTEFEGRILSARLRILTASGHVDLLEATARLRTPAASGALDLPEADARTSTLTATGVLV